MESLTCSGRSNHSHLQLRAKTDFFRTCIRSQTTISRHLLEVIRKFKHLEDYPLCEICEICCACFLISPLELLLPKMISQSQNKHPLGLLTLPSFELFYHNNLEHSKKLSITSILNLPLVADTFSNHFKHRRQAQLETCYQNKS
jgi:hypothetical protein